MVLRKEKNGRKTVDITSRFAVDDYICHRVSGVCAVTSAVAQAVSDSTHRCQLSRTCSSTRWHARPQADVLYAAQTCTVVMYVQITATSQVHARYVMVSLSCQHWVWVFTKADMQNLCSKYGLERLEWLIFCYQCFKTHCQYNSKQRKLPIVFGGFLTIHETIISGDISPNIVFPVPLMIILSHFKTWVEAILGFDEVRQSAGKFLFSYRFLLGFFLFCCVSLRSFQFKPAGANVSLLTYATTGQLWCQLPLFHSPHYYH